MKPTTVNPIADEPRWSIDPEVRPASLYESEPFDGTVLLYIEDEYRWFGHEGVVSLRDALNAWLDDHPEE